LFAQLSAYLDGELPAEARRHIEEHLCDCPPCVEFINSLRRTVDLCHGLEASAAPRPLPDDVRRRMLQACLDALRSRRGGLSS